MYNIAILGHGTVGSGIYELVTKNIKGELPPLKENVVIKKILVQNLDKYRKLEYFSDALFTNAFEKVIKEDLDLVIETIGGIEDAYTYIKESLSKGIHVITANKDLISKFGYELMKLAEENGAELLFEASVGGGIPLIKPLSETLFGNHVDGICGILNGTTNFILSKMDRENLSFKNALKIAQELGFAEANPESDVLGLDPARKISIVSSLAYGKWVDWESIKVEGIDHVTEEDIHIAKSLNGKIKLVAASCVLGKDVHSFVKPVIIDNNLPFSSIHDEYNAVLFNGDSVGNVIFSGKGAGKLPTASAVYSDLTHLINGDSPSPRFKNNVAANIVKEWPFKTDWILKVSANTGLDVVGKVKELNENLEVEILNQEEKKMDIYIKDSLESDILLLKETLSNLSEINEVRLLQHFSSNII